MFYVFPAVTGILILAYYQIQLGGYGKFFELERLVWDVQFSNPVSQFIWLLNAGKSWFLDPIYYIFSLHLTTWYWLVRNLIFEAFYLFGAIYLFKTKSEYRVFLAVYSLLAVVPLLCLTGTPVLSVPRLLLPAFPVFLTYSSLIKKDSHYLIYSAVCLILAAFISIIQVYSFFS